MSSGSDPPRNPRDIQGLLRYCIENVPQMQSNTDSESDSTLNPMNDERREWLNSALNSITNNCVQQMLKCIHIINDGLKSFESTNGVISLETVSEMESVIDTLIDYTGDLDNASDFYKIGGFSVFRPLLESKSDILRSKACELLSECVQNHTICQTYALNEDLLKILVKLLDEEDNENVRIKSVYAISSLIRDNEDAQQLFENELNGFAILLHAMQSNTSHDNKLRIKISFLITSLSRKQSVCQTLYNTGFLMQMIGLLHGRHDSSHQYLMEALFAIVSQHKLSKHECLRKELGLKSLLKEKMDYLKGKPEFSEEEQYVKDLYELCFIDNDLPESER